MTRYQYKYYYGYVICTLLVFSPFKALAYLAPVVLWMFYIVEKFPIVDKRGVKSLLLLLFLFTLFYLFYSIRYSGLFSTQSFVLSFFTFSSLYPLIFLRSALLANSILFDKISRFTKGIFFIQGTIGVIQALYGFVYNGSFDVANGDHVEGTIHLPLPSELSFANPMFSCNMIGMLMLIVTHALVKGKIDRVHLVVPGFFAIILASVLHQILIFAVAIAIAVIILPKVKNVSLRVGHLKKKMIKIMMISAVPLFLILGKNLGTLSGIVSQMFSEEEIPKIIATKNFLVDIPQKYSGALIYGLGPGQFSSRASLMSSGLYLGGPENPRALPLLDISYNPIAKKYVLDVFIEFSKVAHFGSSQKPFYSFLTVLSEFGLIGFIVLLALFLFFIFFLRKRVSRSQNQYAMYYFVCIVSLSFFLFGLGIQVNYYEVVQAVLLPILIIKLSYSQLTVDH